MNDPEFFLRRYAPTTTKIAFIDAPYADVVREVVTHARYLDQFWKTPPSKLSNLDGALATKLDALLPLVTIYPTKTLLTSTRSNWTAYMANHVSGGDVQSQPEHIVQTKLKVRLLTVILSEHDLPNKLGSTQFVVEDHGTGGQPAVRSVVGHFESRWEFAQYGAPFPFEETERYTERRIRDRLTPDLVQRYCHHLGVELFDPDFYDGPATIIERFPTAPNKLVHQFPGLVGSQP